LAASLWGLERSAARPILCRLFAGTWMVYALANAVWVAVLLATAGWHGSQATAGAAAAPTLHARADDWLTAAGCLLGFGVPMLLGGSVAARALAQGEQGWRRVILDFPEFNAADPDQWYQHAVACLEAGDLPTHPAVCAEMLRRFGATTDAQAASRVCYACVVVSGAADGAELVRLATTAVLWFPGNERLLGAAHYRNGNATAAVQRFNDAGTVFTLRAWDYLFLAMAYHAQANGVKARACFDQAEYWCKEANRAEAAGKANPWSGWAERVEVYRLRQEAEALIKG
jgi:hypothetical protein